MTNIFTIASILILGVALTIAVLLLLAHKWSNE